MITPQGLTRVFWPVDCSKTQHSGVLVGWRNSESDVVVISLLRDVEPRAVENALRMGSLLKNSAYPVKDILTRCGSGNNLQVLGSLNPSPAWQSDDSHIVATINKSGSSPSIRLAAHDAGNIQLVMCTRPRPDRMQFLSLHPISLALADSEKALATPFGLEVDEADKQEQLRQASLVEKLHLHSVHKYPLGDKDLALAQIVTQINCAWDIDHLLQQNIGAVRRRSRRTLSVSERAVESALDLWDYTRIVTDKIFTHVIWPVTKWTLVYVLMAIRAVAESVLLCLSYRLRSDYTALKHLSATAQQLDLRLQQLCYWPIQYLTLVQRKDNWQSICDCHAEYIRFYNSLWLVANDMIIGMAVGAYLIDNAGAIASLLETALWTWALQGLKRMIAWLMVYPAGLKLNNELASFLGDLFIWVIDYWAGCMGALRPHFPTLIRVAGFASFAGATMPLSMASDLVSFTTLHIDCFYLASARIYSWQLTIIVSLFHLFRGKKRNVLRSRIDSCDYELDQLLLGTILFTILAFLLPTVLVFYLTFAFARMAIISLKALFDTVLACLNHFPLFALMLRLKDPKRLPGGIRFALQTTRSAAAPARNTSSVITMRSVPLPLPAIFREYGQLGSRIRKHYLSGRVFWRLGTGGFVPPLHRNSLYGLQYSMLPAQRVSIGELWRQLTSSSSSDKPAGKGEAAKWNSTGAGGVANGSYAARASSNALGNASVRRRNVYS